MEKESICVLKILVAEDDQISQYYMERVLGKEGHQLVPVYDGRQCLQALDTGTFDLILMDIEMPGMDGIEATRQIRARTDDKKNIPIIALTAHSLSGVQERCRAAGMNDSLSKPLELETLNKLLSRLFVERG